MLVGLIGLGLAVLGIVVSLVFEFIRHPTVQIEATDWHASGARPYKFVQVSIDDPDPPRFLRFVARQRAERATVASEFRRRGSQELVKSVEPGPIPASDRADSPPGGSRDTYGIAVLFEESGDAYAWSVTSHASNRWQDPHLLLPRGEFDVRVRVEGLGLSCEEAFVLDNTTSNFARFMMVSAGETQIRWHRRRKR
jgi:hypothetical protein